MGVPVELLCGSSNATRFLDRSARVRFPPKTKIENITSFLYGNFLLAR